MTAVEEQQRVVAEWLLLPESRRRDATDVVAFAYRLLRERPDLFDDTRQTTLDTIVGWITPLLHHI
jgi:hypothetical protein